MDGKVTRIGRVILTPTARILLSEKELELENKNGFTTPRYRVISMCLEEYYFLKKRIKDEGLDSLLIRQALPVAVVPASAVHDPVVMPADPVRAAVPVPVMSADAAAQSL